MISSSIVERERARQVLARNFDAGEFAMVAHADLRKAERVQRVFGALHLR